MFGVRDCWGLDLGESGVKAAKLRREGKRLVVEDFFVVPYAEVQSQPPVPRPELIARAITRAAAKIGRGNRVVAGIPSENVLSRFIGLPPVDKRRIPEIVRYEARQQIPFDLSEVQWDYQRVRKDLVPGEEIEIGLFAVRREVVEQYLAALAPVAANLVGLQINPLAVYDYVRRDLKPTEPLIILDIGAKSTDFIIIEGPKFWIRNLPIAGNSFNQVLQKKFNISFEEAEKVKERMEQSRHRAQIFETLRPVIHDLIGEVQRSIGYYKTLSRDVKFEEILVLGHGYRLYGLLPEMTKDLQYRIRPLAKANELTVEGGREEEFCRALPGLVPALGSAIYGLKEGEITISLLPDRFLEQQALMRTQIPALAASIMLALGVGLVYFSNKDAVAQLESLRTIGESELKTAKKLAEEYNAAKSASRTDLDKYLDLATWRGYWGVALRGLSEAIPPEIYISGLEAGAGGTGRGGGSEGSPQTSEALIWRFTAYTDYTQTEHALQVKLPRALRNASVFPEKVPLFRDVTVRGITVVSASAEAAAAVGGELSTEVECTLFSPQELREMRADAAKREEAWKKIREQEAAAAPKKSG